MDNRERALRDALELFTRNYREWLDTSYADKTTFETALALARKMDPAYMAANRALLEARAAIEGEGQMSDQLRELAWEWLSSGNVRIVFDADIDSLTALLRRVHGEGQSERVLEAAPRDVAQTGLSQQD